MARLAVRFLLLLTVLAMVQIVIRGFFQPDDRNELVVILVPVGDGSPDEPTPDFSRGQ